MNRLITCLSFVAIFSLLGGCGGNSDNASTIDNAATTPLVSDTPSSQPDGSSGKDRSSNSQGSGNETASPSDSSMASTNSNNGLFPKMSTGSSSKFGGALFPEMEMTDDEEDSDTNLASIDAGGADDEDQDDAVEEMTPKTADSMTSNEVKDVSLLQDAKKLFQKHADMDAITVVYANHLVSDQARSEYVLNWYPGLKEPRLLFRWGVGIVYSQSRDFEGRHPVIGDPGDPTEGVSASSRGNSGGGLGGPGVTGGGGGGGSRGNRIYKNIDTSRPDGYLMYYTGDFGEKLLSYLDSRRKDDEGPYYGKILKDVMEIELPEDESEKDSRKRNRTRRGNSQASSFGLAGGGGGTGAGNQAQPLQREDTSFIDRAMGNSIAAKPEDDFQGSVLPGVTLLGVGSKSELIERANSAGLDSLIMFNVKVTHSRSSRNRRNSRSAPSDFSTTSMKIIDLKSGANLFNSKPLKDTDVKEKNDDGDDPVKTEIEHAFKLTADKQFKAVEMPSGLKPAHAIQRIERLLANNPSNLLQIAVEIVSYHESGLLNEELANTSLAKLFDSDDATILITGSADERLEFLKDWIPDNDE